ncbi:MAG TPA: CPBP family intramembrane glutamic endopeptidase [Thermoanaerobaculia bacterium]|nr:CPBP family intramembrane glutamic endopeptidase [Thermoanaerobaculia bacterium]
MNNPHMLNVGFFLFVALLFPLPDLWLYPRLQRATAAGVPGARTRYYLLGAATLWLLAGCAVALAIRSHVAWNDLRLGIPTPLRFAAGAAVVIAYVIFAMRQRHRLLAKPERLRRVIKQHDTETALMPHTRSEARSFRVLAVTAGVCEEVVYRGFMIWCATLWLGLWPAVIVSSLVFGVGHLYLGRKHVLRTSIVGLFLALLAVASASLWPGIVLHAFIDLYGGDIGFRSLEAFEQVRDERLRETIGNGADGAALLVE